MAISKTTLNKHADCLVQMSSKLLGNMLEFTAPGDEKCQAMIGKDAADILEISEVLRAGKVQDAFHKMQWLDTAVRESIPNSVWDWCEEVVAYGDDEW